MVKNLFFAAAKFVLFLLVFLALTLAEPVLPQPFRLEHVLGPTGEGTRVYVWDGFLSMTVVFAVILGIEKVRRRINSAGPWTVIAYVLAAVVGYAWKLGFATR